MTDPKTQADHRPSGYTPLSAEDVQLIDEISAAGETLRALVNRVHAHVADKRTASLEGDGSELPTLMDLAQPERWVSIGLTDLQKGLMALKRAVGMPRNF